MSRGMITRKFRQAADGGAYQRAAHGRVEFGILKQCDIAFDADEVHDQPT